MKKNLLKIFLYWITERHSIFLKKEGGDPWPWTKDLILQEYKFTNPFRQNDRVTRELTNQLNTRGRPSDVELFTRIIIFRMFNWPFTYEVLNRAGLVKDWNTTKAIKLLNSRSKEGKKIFTGAYIITNNGKSESKISLVCKAIGKMLKDRDHVVKNIKNNRSLQYASELLSTYPMVGPFIAYELVTDLRHTKVLNMATDIYKWANPGPGAKRGIHRLRYGTKRGELPKGEKIDYQKAMRDLLKITMDETRGSNIFRGCSRFEMRDIEHSLCEFDKYCRVKFDEGRPRSKYRRM